MQTVTTRDSMPTKHQHNWTIYPKKQDFQQLLNKHMPEVLLQLFPAFHYASSFRTTEFCLASTKSSSDI